VLLSIPPLFYLVCKRKIFILRLYYASDVYVPFFLVLIDGRCVLGHFLLFQHGSLLGHYKHILLYLGLQNLVSCVRVSAQIQSNSNSKEIPCYPWDFVVNIEGL